MMEKSYVLIGFLNLKKKCALDIAKGYGLLKFYKVLITMSFICFMSIILFNN